MSYTNMSGLGALPTPPSPVMQPRMTDAQAIMATHEAMDLLGVPQYVIANQSSNPLDRVGYAARIASFLDSRGWRGYIDYNSTAGKNKFIQVLLSELQNQYLYLASIDNGFKGQLAINMTLHRGGPWRPIDGAIATYGYEIMLLQRMGGKPQTGLFDDYVRTSLQNAVRGWLVQAIGLLTTLQQQNTASAATSAYTAYGYGR